MWFRHSGYSFKRQIKFSSWDQNCTLHFSCCIFVNFFVYKYLLIFFIFSRISEGIKEKIASIEEENLKLHQVLITVSFLLYININKNRNISTTLNKNTRFKNDIYVFPFSAVETSQYLQSKCFINVVFSDPLNYGIC
jgi:hypothetical protein